ncbi:hypothetical protein [Azohydromonas aeria]|uniref:hypothetical protein n=1 Tax=Azohydromonas aeria TaxID=2590212 RepID=UPI0012F8E229|nr:hypothetical protein [Azohydromonas aeria]
MQILARVKELSEATRRLGSGRRRWIGVGSVPSLLYGVLPNVIHDFMRQHAELDVVVSELTSVEQIEALKSGRTAVGMVAAGIGISLVPSSVQRFRRDDIVYRPISDVGIVSSMLMTTRLDDQSEDLAKLCEATVRACANEAEMPIQKGAALPRARSRKQSESASPPAKRKRRAA